MKFKIEFSFQLFKKRTGRCDVFIQKASESIDGMSMAGKYATVRNYRTALNSFSAFVSEKKLQNQEVNSVTMNTYQKWLLLHSVCENTTANYLRYLRALFNMQHPNAEVSPFSNLTTTNAATAKRSLSADEVRRLRNLIVPENSALGLYRDIFLFSTYTFGIPFVDLARMTYRNINAGVITFNRQKTSKAVSVALLPEAQQILDRYLLSDSDYLFPQITHSHSYQVYQQELAKYNRALRRLSAMAGIKARLTSYVARHTWASLAYSNGTDVGIISQALGHSNLRTTMIYLRELDMGKISTAGQKIVSTLC